MNKIYELPDTVRMLCSECAPKPDPRFRTIHLREFVGKDCKLKFGAEITEEHMWVRCTGLAKDGSKELRGTLDSVPVFDAGVRFGDVVEFSRSEIEDCVE